jgi:hypothetical protein
MDDDPYTDIGPHFVVTPLAEPHLTWPAGRGPAHARPPARATRQIYPGRSAGEIFRRSPHGPNHHCFEPLVWIMASHLNVRR